MVTGNRGGIVRIGSRQHDFEGKHFIISSISPDDKGLNSGNVDDEETSGTCAEEGLQWRFTLLSVRYSWIEATLLVKNSANCSAKLISDVDLKRDRGVFSPCTVCTLDQ